MQIKKISGYLPDKYSKYADKAFTFSNQPIVSFPIELADLPNETQFLALTLVDYDAVPVCGFPWIHWVVANIPVTELIPENFSQTDTQSIRGKNSFGSPFLEPADDKLVEHYVGPTPPDKDHHYTLTVYALDAKLALQNGFYLNELRTKLNQNVLDQTSIDILAKK